MRPGRCCPIWPRIARWSRSSMWRRCPASLRPPTPCLTSTGGMGSRSAASPPPTSRPAGSSHRAELEKVLAGGARYAVEQGHGTGRDLARCEDEGAVADAEPARVSQRAVDRGLRQVGSLGSGNHFLEVQVVGEVFDPAAAELFGL